MSAHDLLGKLPLDPIDFEPAVWLVLIDLCHGSDNPRVTVQVDGYLHGAAWEFLPEIALSIQFEDRVACILPCASQDEDRAIRSGRDHACLAEDSFPSLATYRPMEDVSKCIDNPNRTIRVQSHAYGPPLLTNLHPVLSLLIIFEYRITVFDTFRFFHAQSIDLFFIAGGDEADGF